MGYSRRPRERQMEGKGDAVTDGGVNPRDRRGPAWPPWSTSGPALFAVGERARRVDPDAAGVSAPAGWKRAAGPGFVVHVDPVQESPLAFALSVAAGLDERPRRLDARYLYDAAGSDLFDRITSQPEYYLTRAEDQLLANGARAIRAAAGFGTLAELGSGTSTKTRRLLAAWCAAGPAAYGPVDVDLQFLTQACATLRADYPPLASEGLGASYDRAMPVLAEVTPKTLAFLGSSLGNLGWRAHTEFCASVAAALSPGDHFLIGVDLVKDAALLEAAYDDAAGVTAAFTRNLFARMNRELGTDVPLDSGRRRWGRWSSGWASAGSGATSVTARSVCFCSVASPPRRWSGACRHRGTLPCWRRWRCWAGRGRARWSWSRRWAKRICDSSTAG